MPAAYCVQWAFRNFKELYCTLNFEKCVIFYVSLLSVINAFLLFSSVCILDYFLSA